MRKKLDRKWVWLILVVVGLVVFANSLPNNFVWDDEEQVVNNTLVHSLKNLPYFFSGSTFNTGGASGLSGMYYKPLMTVAFATMHGLFGPRAMGFHAVQIGLHILNAILVYLFFKELYGRLSFKKNKISTQLTSWLALLGAVVFLIHPLNVETVVYVSSMQDILFFLFGIGATLVMMKKEVKFKWLFAVFGGLLFSLLSKETGIVWVVFIPIVAWILQRSFWKKWSLVVSGVSFTVYAFLRFAVAGVGLEKHGLSPITQMSFTERLWSVPKIVVYYLQNYLWPNKLAISQHWVVKGASWKAVSWNEFYLPLLIVFLVGMGLLWVGWKLWQNSNEWRRVFGVFFILFCLGMGIHLQIFPLDMTVADRWFYLPQLGLWGMVSLLFLRWGSQVCFGWKRKVLVGLVGLVLVALSIRSMVRNRNWRDGLTLYSHDIKIAVDSFDLENNFGVELYRVGRKEEAKVHFTRSTELADHWWTNWSNLGVIIEEEGDLETAAVYYQRAIDNGQYFLAFQNLARVKALRNPEAAIVFIKDSLELLPYNAELYKWWAVAEYELENKDAALQILQRSFELAPSQKTAQLYWLMDQGEELEF
ncbi:hypothetical protein KKE34_00450 [Patescibacteria group bacterium]|nr:hypothetical protein [Patescibacteria group bacterium]MBU1885065.1 hypothetical protein [Patescibacteria group bacterium]